jgi:hypothetical protein
MLLQGVVWNTQNCTMDESANPPLLTVNSLHVDLTRSDLRIVPAMADAAAQVQALPDIAASANPNFIAGINGGYFWRVDIDGFWRDNVCRGKTRDEAEHDVSSDNVNYGISDGLIKANGVVLGNNCNCSGYSRPAVLKIDGSNSDIDVLYRGETVDDSVPHAIGAGPNLLSYDVTLGESYVDIPSDDDNINKFVYEATAAVGIVLESQVAGSEVQPPATEMVLITTDGSDSCMPNEPYCGLVSPNLASLMKEVFNCGLAMSMDQGGSTTMWIAGEEPERNGVVSKSDNKEPSGGGARSIANGLFIEVI